MLGNGRDKGIALYTSDSFLRQNDKSAADNFGDNKTPVTDIRNYSNVYADLRDQLQGYDALVLLYTIHGKKHSGETEIRLTTPGSTIGVYPWSSGSREGEYRIAADSSPAFIIYALRTSANDFQLFMPTVSRTGKWCGYSLCGVYSANAHMKGELYPFAITIANAKKCLDLATNDGGKNEGLLGYLYKIVKGTSPVSNTFYKYNYIDSYESGTYVLNVVVSSTGGKIQMKANNLFDVPADSVINNLSYSSAAPEIDSECLLGNYGIDLSKYTAHIVDENDMCYMPDSKKILYGLSQSRYYDIDGNDQSILKTADGKDTVYSLTMSDGTLRLGNISEENAEDGKMRAGHRVENQSLDITGVHAIRPKSAR